jgi:hypothetical protein
MAEIGESSGGSMTRRSRREWPPPTFVEPPYVSNVHRPGDKGTADPFYAFKRRARDDGRPYKSPEPKAERALLALLGTNAALVVMSCLALAVVATLLVLLVLRA